MSGTFETPEAFAALAGLIALVTDAKGCAKRMDELRSLGAEIVKAQAKLDADRAEHDRSVAAAKAELAVREEVINRRALRAIQFD